jgi:hypothetical protein
MSNKKGAGAIEQLPGIFTITIAIMLMLLFFWGCSANREAKKTSEFEFSKSEIETIKALNFFLEMPIEEDKKVMDIIIEAVNEDDDEKYRTLNTAAVNHFSETYDYWLLKFDGYDSIDYNGYDEMSSILFDPPLPEVKTKIYDLGDDLELREFEITLQLRANIW